ncbi:MAG TPA: dihydroorotase family protein [Candidatus Methylomirabilis sp.]|nr:dihydroorotase family protein [Candidatus Methylomirabilis sp.]
MEEIFFQLPREIINLHIHARDLREARKTTVWQTLQEAAAAGIKIAGLMPNTKPAIISAYNFENYEELVEDAERLLHRIIRAMIWLGVTDKNSRELEKLIKRDRALGLKIYPKSETGKVITTGSCGVAQVSAIIRAMEIAADARKPVAVHPEYPLFGHSIQAEVEYVRLIIYLARMVLGVKIIICHVSCQESAELILAAQQEGLLIALELCPHYLWFDESGTNWRPGLHPDFYKCYNPLRGPADREYLVGLLPQENELIFVASDHAPHLEKEKLAGAAGIPSLYETVPVIVTHAIQRGIPENQIAKLISFNAAKFFGFEVNHNLRRVKFALQEDRLCYNKGRIVNPWQGAKLYFPQW